MTTLTPDDTPDDAPDCRQCPDDFDERPRTYLPISDKYGIEELKAASLRKMRSKLNQQNVVEYLILADLHQCQKLRTECLARLKEWKSWLAKDALNPLVNYPKLMLEILKM